MQTENYNVDYFIKKFKAIREERWITNYQDDGHGNHCAIGWCNVSKNYCGSCAESNIEIKALHLLFMDYGIKSVSNHEDRQGWNIADVNNGDHPDYRQKSPKQRILAALYGIKKMQQPEIKTVIKYVAVSEKIRECSLALN